MSIYIYTVILKKKSYALLNRYVIDSREGHNNWSRSVYLKLRLKWDNTSGLLNGCGVP
jgi:hypothetical protein